jgi:hypothetical protein
MGLFFGCGDRSSGCRWDAHRSIVINAREGRDVRALREMRGMGLAVTVANYGQVNVGAVLQNSSARPCGRR